MAKHPLTRGKACKILSDGSIKGKRLTSAQRGFFGAQCTPKRKRR